MNSQSGIAPSKVFLPSDDQNHLTVLDFLVHQFPAISQDEWVSRFEDGLISDVDGLTLEVSTAYRPNTWV